MSLLRTITIVRGRTRKSFRGRTILKIAEGVTTLLSIINTRLTQIEALIISPNTCKLTFLFLWFSYSSCTVWETLIESYVLQNSWDSLYLLSYQSLQIEYKKYFWQRFCLNESKKEYSVFKIDGWSIIRPSSLNTVCVLCRFASKARAHSKCGMRYAW